MSSEPDKWALLVGINFYMPPDWTENPHRINLKGCVGDIDRVEKCLKETQGFKDSNIIRLTASTPPDDPWAEEEKIPVQPAEPDPANWPTYENIRKALGELAKKPKGDLVYFHYSGHGTRAKTVRPELKGEDGMDESIVPTDFRRGGSLLRDFEMAYWLNQIVEAGLILTVVLDSCKSAGAVRDADPDEPVVAGRGISNVEGLMKPDPIPDIPLPMLRPIWEHQQSIGAGNDSNRAIIKVLAERGLPNVDDLMRPDPTPNIPLSELRPIWDHQLKKAPVVKKNWLLEADGYEFLAACRANELANEDRFNGEWQGALTHSLVNALETGGPSLTHRMLHRKVYDDVYSQFKNQSPVLSGMVERPFLGVIGSDSVRPIHTISATKSRVPGHVKLRGGEAHGISVGSVYAICPWNASDLTNTKDRIAKVIVTHTSGMVSQAKILGDPIETLPTGTQIVPLARPSITYIKLLERSDVPSDVPQTKMLEQIRNLDWKKYGSGTYPLSLLADDDRGTATFHLAVNDRGEYELRDPIQDSTPFPNVQSSHEPEAILTSAAHLAHFFSTQDSKNMSASSVLRKSFSFEILERKPENGIYQIPEGESIKLHFKNKSWDPVNLTILNYGSEYGITQLYPGNTHYETIDSKHSCTLPVELKTTPGIHTIKAMVTVKPTSFRSLEMPDIALASTVISTSWNGEVIEKNETFDTRIVDDDDPDLNAWESASLRIHIVASQTPA